MRFAEHLDPEVDAALDAVPRLDMADIPTARRERAELAAVARERWQPSGRVLTDDRTIPGLDGEPDVRVRLHRPRGGADGAPVLLWAHGGGHCLGTADQDDPLLDALVAESGCVAVSVDWRRAPEHPYPAAVHDCYAALGWLARSGAEVGADPRRIVVAGPSSGGGLAAGVVLMARDRGEAAVSAQLLIYPMLDDRAATRSSHAVTDPRVWNADSNRLAWGAYLGACPADDVPVYAAPSRAADLTGLPPTWIAIGELDLFVDENVEYARRLMAAGVSVELHVYPGAVHGFDVFAPHAAVAQRFTAERDRALRAALRPGSA